MRHDHDTLDTWLDALEHDAGSAGRPPRDGGSIPAEQRQRLLGLLAHHADPAAREVLVRLVRRLAPSPQVADALARCITTDPAAAVRRRAVAIAAREHDSEDTRAAVAQALGDTDEDVSRMAATSICECRAPASLSGDEVEALCDYVARGDTGQEGRVGRLLAVRSDARAVAMLRHAVEHASHFWHHAGRRPLERAETFSALAALAPSNPADRDDIESLLVDAVRRDPYSWGKEAAWRGLEALGWTDDDLVSLYRDVEPATHPPSGEKARQAFDPGAERARLASAWAPRLTAPDARLRADARTILRWIKRPEVADVVRACVPRVPGDERRRQLTLANDLDALA